MCEVFFSPAVYALHVSVHRQGYSKGASHVNTERCNPDSHTAPIKTTKNHKTKMKRKRTSEPTTATTRATAHSNEQVQQQQQQQHHTHRSKLPKIDDDHSHARATNHMSSRIDANQLLLQSHPQQEQQQLQLNAHLFFEFRVLRAHVPHHPPLFSSSSLSASNHGNSNNMHIFSPNDYDSCNMIHVSVPRCFFAQIVTPRWLSQQIQHHLHNLLFVRRQHHGVRFGPSTSNSSTSTLTSTTITITTQEEDNTITRGDAGVDQRIFSVRRLGYDSHNLLFEHDLGQWLFPTGYSSADQSRNQRCQPTRFLFDVPRRSSFCVC